MSRMRRSLSFTATHALHWQYRPSGLRLFAQKSDAGFSWWQREHFLEVSGGRVAPSSAIFLLRSQHGHIGSVQSFCRCIAGKGRRLLLNSLPVLLCVVDRATFREEAEVGFKMGSIGYEAFMSHTRVEILRELESNEAVVQQRLVRDRIELDLTSLHSFQNIGDNVGEFDGTFHATGKGLQKEVEVKFVNRRVDRGGEEAFRHLAHRNEEIES